MIDASTIPEPVNSIFKAFRIGNNGNDDAWLGWTKKRYQLMKIQCTSSPMWICIHTGSNCWPHQLVECVHGGRNESVQIIVNSLTTTCMLDSCKSMVANTFARATSRGNSGECITIGEEE